MKTLQITEWDALVVQGIFVATQMSGLFVVAGLLVLRLRAVERLVPQLVARVIGDLDAQDAAMESLFRDQVTIKPALQAYIVDRLAVIAAEQRAQVPDPLMVSWAGPVPVFPPVQDPHHDDTSTDLWADSGGQAAAPGYRQLPSGAIAKWVGVDDNTVPIFAELATAQFRRTSPVGWPE